MIGELINGRYRIECEAGSGGMADVYKAHDLKTDRTVALKVIKKDYCRDPKYVRRFEREAQAVLSLKNANIVCAYDYGTYDSRSFIVMEFVKGCTLKEYLSAKKKLDVKTAVGIAEKILDALECAHNAGYIHRDVKPQNVLISTTGDKTHRFRHCQGCRCNNKNVRREKRCGFGPLYFPGTGEGRGSRNGKRYIFRGNNAF